MKKLFAGLLCLLFLTGCIRIPLPLPVSEPDPPTETAAAFDSSLSPVAVYDTETATWFALGDAREKFEATLGAGVERPDFVGDAFAGTLTPGQYTFYEYLRGRLVVEYVNGIATGITLYNRGGALTRFTYRGTALENAPVSFLETLFWDAYEDDAGGVDRYDYFYEDTGAFGYVEFESYVYLYAGELDSFGIMVYDLDTLLYGKDEQSGGIINL